MIASFIFVLTENGKFLHVLQRKILGKKKKTTHISISNFIAHFNANIFLLNIT